MSSATWALTNRIAVNDGHERPMSADGDSSGWAEDRAEVESLLTLFARGHDVDPRYYEKCVADDVEIDYGEALTFQGLAALRQIRKDNWADASNPDGRFKFTQHLISNTLVEIDGDTARSQCYVQASHGLVGEDGKLAVVPVGAIYTQHSARTPAGWRVTRHHCRLLWIHDPDGLMPDSAAMMDDPTRREGLLW